MNPDEAEKKAKEIETIYQEAQDKLRALQEEQSRIIEASINKLKEKRLIELRELIAKSQS